MRRLLAGLAIQRFRQAYAGLIANSDESGQPEIVFAIVTCETNRLQPEKSDPMFKIEWGKILRCSSIYYTDTSAGLVRPLEADESAFFGFVVRASLMTMSTATLADDAGKDEPVIFGIGIQWIKRSL